MADPNQTIRIFISSPGDVIEERDGARRVIEGLQRLYPRATLKSVLWEELALPATASFQETIDFLLEREPIDIAVFILWSRLGSPLGASVMRPNGMPYRSGTEREFELMLAAFEQSGRKRPTILAYIRDDDAAFREKLTACPKAQLEELIEQRKLAEGFVTEQFHDAEGRNLRAYQTYREPIGFQQRLRIHLRQAIDDQLQVDSAVTWTEEPYRGLETFDIQHAPIFYGREEETCDLLQRLRDQEQAGCSFVVIVGASGSGKSSLARAGVAANLIQNSGDDAAQWRVSSFIPALAGQSLCHSLVRSLANVLPELIDSDDATDNLAEGLSENASLTVRLTIVPAFARSSRPVRLLLILDQMEELWTDRQTTAEDRESFLAAVEALARSGCVAVLATLRSDFYYLAQQSTIFLRLKGERGHYDLLPPDAASIHRLITEPARLSGLQFERNEKTVRSLDEVILEDASHDPNSLPLLEYTLSELYRQRDEERRLLTYAAYVELGGVEGAIGKRANETFTSLPKEAQAALDEILPLLVSVDVAGEQVAVRRRATVADLTSTPARKTLTDQLIAARFLTTDRQDKQPIASLAHEALLRRWDGIANWINANREQLRLRARVEQLQQRWEQQDRHASLLLAAGLPLDEGRQLLRDAPHLLTDATKDYISDSFAHHERRAKQSRRVRTAVLSTIAALLLAMLVGAIAAWRINEKNKRIAENENRQIEADGLVKRLLQVEASELQDVLADLDPYRDLTRDDLVAAYEGSEDTSKAKLHTALALLDEEDSALPFLKERLLQVTPVQFGFVRDLLEDHKGDLVKNYWIIAKDSEQDRGRRFQAACVLASYDPENEEWRDRKFADFVAGHLVGVLPSELLAWRNTLRPVQKHLVPALCTIYRDKSQGEQSRSFATDTLADYLSDDVNGLFELLMDAEPKQFTALFDGFAKHGDNAVVKLHAEIDRVLTPNWNDPSLDPTWKQPAEELIDKLERADGLVAERFAFCQTLPLEDFAAVAEALKQSGYRPIRLRPYTHQDSVKVAAAWSRDGRGWQSRISRSAASILEEDEWQRNDGFVAVDVAGYIGSADGKPAERFAALWVKRQSDGDDARIYAGIPFAEHVAAYRKLEESGFKFQHTLQSFRDLAGRNRYCGVKWKLVATGNWWGAQTATDLDDKLFLDKIHWDIAPSEAADPDTTKQRNERALADAEAKLKEDADNLNARFRRGQAYFYLGQNEKSLEDMGQIVQSWPRFATSYQFRSILYARIGDGAAALADLQHFKQRNSSETARACLDVVVSSYLGKESGAINRLETIIQEGRDNDATLYAAACAYSLVSGVFRERDPIKSRLYANKAVALLRQAIAFGYNNYSHIQEDADLDPVRDHESFVELMKAGGLHLRYAAVWNESTQFESRESHGLSPAEHLHQCRTMQQNGYRLVSISATSVDGNVVTASVWHRPLVPKESIEALARRQANAAAAMARLGKREELLPALRITDDPESLTQFVHRCREEGVTTAQLLECLKVADRSRQALGSNARRIEDRVLFGLLLALGEFTLDELPSDQKQATVEQIGGWYRDDPSSAIHGATGWLLRRWGQTNLVRQVDETVLPYDPEREWFTLVIDIDPQRFYQTYVVIPPGDYEIGSPWDEPDRRDNETLNRVRLTRPVAILDREITCGEFKASGVENIDFDLDYGPTLEHPMVGPSWYDSVQFCRWLTTAAGFSAADQAYLDPSELNPAQYPRDAETNLPKNWPLNLDARGFRLPTEAEWEIAARGGMRTMYAFGADASLLDRYGWVPPTGQRHISKELRPNLLGLFDMHGNPFEWCHDWLRSYPLGNIRSDPAGFSTGAFRVFRGGSWGDAANCRSARRNSRQPSQVASVIGLRIAFVPVLQDEQAAEVRP